jgi:hypothetical protein
MSTTSSKSGLGMSTNTDRYVRLPNLKKLSISGNPEIKYKDGVFTANVNCTWKLSQVNTELSISSGKSTIINIGRGGAIQIGSGNVMTTYNGKIRMNGGNIVNQFSFDPSTEIGNVGSIIIDGIDVTEQITGQKREKDTNESKTFQLPLDKIGGLALDTINMSNASCLDIDSHFCSAMGLTLNLSDTAQLRLHGEGTCDSVIVNTSQCAIVKCLYTGDFRALDIRANASGKSKIYGFAGIHSFHASAMEAAIICGHKYTGCDIREVTNQRAKVQITETK